MGTVKPSQRRGLRPLAVGGFAALIVVLPSLAVMSEPLQAQAPSAAYEAAQIGLINLGLAVWGLVARWM